jgi:hypothetical protein
MLLIAQIVTELLIAHTADIQLKFMEQPVALEQTGVRESLVTYVTCHPLSDVLRYVVKFE